METQERLGYVISCGLREGYEADGVEHTPQEARSVIGAWIEERMKAGLPVVAGMLTVGEFAYPLEVDGTWRARFEPAITYQGIVRPEEAAKAEEMLTSLGERLASAFKQKRVHCAHRDRTWTVSF